MAKKKLLIMEDNVDHLGMMKTYLELEGYEVETATNGRLGVESIMKSLPDLIVTDYQMPELDGMEILKILKSNSKTEHIPIIIVTGAKTSSSNVIEGLAAGVDAYLPKPFELDELSAAIQELFKLIEDGKLPPRSSPGMQG